MFQLYRATDAQNEQSRIAASIGNVCDAETVDAALEFAMSVSSKKNTFVMFHYFIGPAEVGFYF